MPKAPRFSPDPVRVVEVLTYPVVQLLDVTGPVQVFASANDLVDAGGASPYQLKVVGRSGEGATSSAGMTPTAGPLTRDNETLDTMLVAGGEGARAAAEDRALVTHAAVQTGPSHTKIGSGSTHGRKAVGEPGAELPMGRGAAAVQEADSRKQKGAGPTAPKH
jgi:transcriptional regulator GlxA family with amidase domain